FNSPPSPAWPRALVKRAAKFQRVSNVDGLIQLTPPGQPATLGGLRISWPSKRRMGISSRSRTVASSKRTEPTTYSTGDFTCSNLERSDTNASERKMASVTLRTSCPEDV